MSNVTPIRNGVRIRKENHANDERAIYFERLARRFEEKAAASEPDSEEHRLSLHMTAIRQKTPRYNLRCIHSTLDEKRDFQLRLAEAVEAHATARLSSAQAQTQAALHGWSHSGPEWRAHVERYQDLWDRYRAAIMLLAHAPARTRAQLSQKLHTIGKAWLTATGEWYDELRAGVAADEAWLAENMPTKRRAKA